MEKNNSKVEEKIITKKSGMKVLLLVLLGFTALTALLVSGCCLAEAEGVSVASAILISVPIVGGICLIILCSGFRIVNPNEAVVLTLFGQYYGTIKSEGFYYVNPFVTQVVPAKQASGSASASAKKKISLKTLTLNNEKQKVNDALGNPIIIGAVVIWKVVNPTDAVFNVENYKTFLSTQCDSIIRKIARLYPYDLMTDEEDEESGEKTLRGSSQEIAESMCRELQKKVGTAGIQVEEVRITHLSYAEEIAAVMLQKQQASAVIAARKKIVEGAVSMVQMAVNQLGEDEVVTLDEERKAAMVSNLMVVLCGNKEAQPVVNSSSIY